MRSFLTMLSLTTLFLCPLPKSQAQNLGLEWAKQIGGTGSDYVQSIDVDDNGNVYGAGYFSTTAQFNLPDTNAKLVSKGGLDAYLLKMDAEGNHVWSRGFGGRLSDQAQCVSVDQKHGFVYLTGGFTDTVEFNPGGTSIRHIAKGASDIFISKYDTSGNLLWAKAIGGAGVDVGWSIAPDQQGNIFVTGSFNGQVEFNPGGASKILQAGTNRCAFIAKYNPEGQLLWANQLSTEGSEGNSLAVDNQGSVYITGTFGLAATFLPANNNITLTAVGGEYDLFVAKADSAGIFQWAQSIGSPGEDISFSVAVDSHKQVYIGGYFNDTLKFSNGFPDVPTRGKNDFLVSKLDATGKIEWVRSGGGIALDVGEEVTVDAAGNVYLVGDFNGTAYFSPDTANSRLVNRGSNLDNFILKLDNDGNFLWVKQLGGSSLDQSNDVKIDGSGTLYVGGYFRSANANFEPNGQTSTLYKAAGADGFIVKFSCTDTNSSTLPISTCDKEITFMNHTFSASGQYPIPAVNISGCDSTIVLDLVFNVIEKPIVNVDKRLLSTTRSYSSYQWLLNDEAIDGATDSAYTVVANGFYKVAVTDENGCTDTSDAYEVSNFNSIDEQRAAAANLSIYPNPMQDVLHIQSSIPLRWTLTGLDGRVVYTGSAGTLHIGHLDEGLYFLKIADTAHNLLHIEKLVKVK